VRRREEKMRSGEERKSTRKNTIKEEGKREEGRNPTSGKVLTTCSKT
jgi:hypothetical protein